MPDNSDTAKRSPKKSIRVPLKIKHRLEIRRRERKIKELEDKLEGGWLSPDGKFCDIKYASRYVGLGIQTLRNMKARGIGPVTFADSGTVRYKIELLEAYRESGYSQVDYDRENKP